MLVYGCVSVALYLCMKHSESPVMIWGVFLAKNAQDLDKKLNQQNNEY